MQQNRSYIKDRSTGGFTFIETLVSIVLILFITLTVSTVFINILRHNEYASASLQESWTILYGDQKLREKIEPIIIPYWENSITATKIVRTQILDKTTIPGIHITDVEIVSNNGVAQGLIVSYTVLENPRKYQSYILFSSSGIQLQDK